MSYANESTLTNEEKEWIKNNEVIIGISEWYPIINVNKNNHMEGLLADILKVILNKYNIKNKIVNHEWSKVLEKVKSGEIDITPGVYYTKKREKYGLFSENIHQLKEYLYVKENSTIQDFKSLKNKRIAIIKDYATAEIIKDTFPSIKIISTKNLKESIDMVLTGNADALYDAQIVVQQFLKNNLISGLKALPQSAFDATNLYFYSNKNKPLLNSILNKGLKSISTDEKNQIIYKWMNVKIKAKTLIFNNQEKLYLRKKGNLKLCVDPNWMPFEKITNDGKHEGIAADYIKVFENKIGIPINLVPTTSWSQTLDFAKKRNCDIISMALDTPSKKEYFNFTIPYFKVPLILVTKDNITFITDFSVLNNKKIGIQKEYGTKEIIQKKYPKIDVVEVKDLYSGLKKVESSQLFGQIATNISAAYELQKNFRGSLQISAKFEKDLHIRTAVRNDEPELLTIFNKAIQSIENSTRQKILNTWAPVKYENNFDYSLFWKIIVIILIILLFIIYKHILLNNHNKQLKKAKKEIEKLNNTLEKKVENRTEALRKKTNELELLNDTLDIKIKRETNKRKEHEQLLIQQSRLAEMGDMISMIAHQWRQPLNALRIQIQNIELFHKMNNLNNNLINGQINNSNYIINQMSQTIDDFRNFFEPNREKKEFSLTTAIQQAMGLIDATFRHHEINIQVSIKKDILIYGFGNEFSQVILNIINNAKDKLIEEKIENPQISVTLTYSKDNVIIEIEDNASGIDDSIGDKIFEPYFSTKSDKNGTGLGLYMSKMIIEQNMHGTLNYKNKNKGVSFIIKIPIHLNSVQYL